MKKLLKKNETYIFLVLLILCFLVELRSGQFFKTYNIYDLLVSFAVSALFALAEYVVIVSGGIDVSFPIIASTCMNVVASSLADYEGGIWLAIIMAACIGTVMGAINGLIIAKFKFPPLIVTLGTQSLYTGFLMTALHAREISGSALPACINRFGTVYWLTTENPTSGAISYVPASISIMLVMIVATWLLMKYTTLGRSVYAVGNDETAALRAGFHVERVRVFVYAYAGFIAGIAGIVRLCIAKFCHPTALTGVEMEVIAAVVLGGVSVVGGKGSVLGALLGMAVITVMKNSLLLLGIPTIWQTFCTGALILAGVAISAYQVTRSNKKLATRKVSPEGKTE